MDHADGTETRGGRSATSDSRTWLEFVLLTPSVLSVLSVLSVVNTISPEE